MLFYAQLFDGSITFSKWKISIQWITQLVSLILIPHWNYPFVYRYFEKSFKVKEVCTCYNCLNYGKVWTNFIRAFWKYFEIKVLRIVIKTVNIQVIVVVIHLHCFQVVQNLFGKVSISLQKAPNLGRFKKT